MGWVVCSQKARAQASSLPTLVINGLDQGSPHRVNKAPTRKLDNYQKSVNKPEPISYHFCHSLPHLFLTSHDWEENSEVTILSIAEDPSWVGKAK